MTITRTELERRFDHFHDGVRSPEIHPRHGHLDGSIRNRLLWLTQTIYEVKKTIYQYDNIAVEMLTKTLYTQEGTCTLNGVWGNGLVHSLKAMEVAIISKDEGAFGSYFTCVFTDTATRLRLEMDKTGDVACFIHYDESGIGTPLNPNVDYEQLPEHDRIQLEFVLTNDSGIKAKLFSYALLWD